MFGNLVKEGNGDGSAGEVILAALHDSMKPRDAFEEVLIVQAALIHKRIFNLSLKAADQQVVQNVALMLAGARKLVSGW